MNLYPSHPGALPPSSASTAPSPLLSANFTYNLLGERTKETLTHPTPPGQSGQSGPPTSLPLATLSYGYNTTGEMTSYNGPMGGSPLSIATTGGPGMGFGHMPTPLGTSQASTTYTYDPSGLIASETSTVVPSPPSPTCPPPAHPSTGSSAPHTPPCTTTSTTSFTWDSSSAIPEMIGAGSYSYIYGPQGTPTEQIGPNGSILYYLTDRQGSTIALVNSSANVVARYAYSPYGSLICGPTTPPASPPTGLAPCHPSPPSPPAACPPPSTHCSSGPSPCLSRAVRANHFLYDGQYLDSISGLYYLRARWYDPATGQFTSVDALVAITGQPYSYASGNPVNESDPSGMFGCGFLWLSSCGSSGPYSCETLSSWMWNKSGASPAGCPGGVYVYSKLIGYINNHSSPKCFAQFLHNASHILGTLWKDVYRLGAIGHNNCYRWAGTQSNCTFSSFISWFSWIIFSASQLGIQYALMNAAENSLVGLVNGGSREGTLAWWFSRITTNNLTLLEPIASLSEDAISKVICLGAGGFVASEICQNF